LAARNLLVIFKQQSNAFKDALLAGGFIVQQYIVGQQNFADQVHGSNGYKKRAALLPPIVNYSIGAVLLESSWRRADNFSLCFLA